MEVLKTHCNGPVSHPGQILLSSRSAKCLALKKLNFVRWSSHPAAERLMHIKFLSRVIKNALYKEPRNNLI